MKQDNDGLEINIDSETDKSSIDGLVNSFKKLDSVFGKVINTFKKFTNNMSPTVEKLNEVSKVAEEAHKSLSKSPKASYSKVYQDLEGLKSEYNALQKTVNNIDLSPDAQNYTEKSKSELERLYSEYEKTYSAIEQKRRELSAKLDEPMDDKSLDNVYEEYKKAGEAMGEMLSKQADIQNALRFKEDMGKDISYKDLIDKLDKYESKIKETKTTWDTLREESKKPLPLNLKPAKKDIDKLNEDLEETGRVTEKTGKKFSLFGWLGKKSFDLLKKSIRKSLGIFPGIGKLVGNTTDTLFNKFKKLGLGLLTVRTAMSVLTKSVSAYLSFDGALQDSITNSWNMLGSLLAPAIELVAQLFATATTYIYMFVKALTGIDLVARANAKALKTQAAATKAAGQAQRSLSSMDEITNLQTDSAGGSGAEAPQIEVPKIEPGSIFSDLIEALKNGEWYKAGEIIANGINDALGNIPWGKIKSGATKFGKGLADFFNGIIDNLDWHLVGTTIGNGLQTAINFAYELFTNFHWIEFGTGLGEALNGAFEKIEWDKLGKTIHNGLMGIINSITYFIKTVDWEQLGESLREFIDNLDLSDLASRFYELLKTAFGGISEFLKGLLHVDKSAADTLINVLLGIAGAVVVFKTVNGILEKFSKTKDSVKEATTTIGNSFGKMLESLGKAATLIALLGGIALVVNSLSNLFKTFAETGMSASEGLLLLGGTIVIVVGAFAILSKTIKAIPIPALLSFVVVMGMLSLTMLAVSELFKAFADSSLSVGGAIGLLVTVFAGLVIMMVAVAAIGPSMTAGLVPFAAVVGLIIATLLVLAATLPTILDAVGKFVTTVAPPLVSIINAIYNGIGNLIYALGTALPPIINAIGGVFNTVFNGIANIVDKVGNVIVKIMKTASNSTSSTLNTILSFINRLGPAVNNLVNNLISAVTNLVNFVIRAMEHLVNISVVPAANAIIDVVNKAPGINIKKASKVHIPRLATGTNEIPKEGIYHLHEGEAVVPKKYNPATGGYDNGADNQQIIELLVSLNANMLALSEREMAVYMDGRKVAEGIYNDIQTVTKNKNVSNNVVRS